MSYDKLAVFLMKKALYTSIVVLILVMVVTLMFINQYRGVQRQPTSPAQNTSSESPQTSVADMAVYNITSEGFHIVDEIVYIRFKVWGYVDLREKREINGVYGTWSGFVTVIVPNGIDVWVFTPPDYSVGRNHFTHITGSVEYDAPVYDLRGGSPSVTHPQSPLNGTYKVTVWLSGPYDEKIGDYPRVVLMEKNFTYTFKASVELKPLKWSSWDQEVVVTVVNEGDTPLFFTGGSVLIHGVNTVVGWLSIWEDYVPIEVGGSRDVATKLTFLEDYKTDYEGKTKQVDVLFHFKTVSFINVTYTIEFPNQ